MTTLALPRPDDGWIAERGLYVPSRDWFSVPKALRGEIRFGRVEEAMRELLRSLGIAKAVTENPLIGGTASEKSSAASTTYTTGAFTATAGSVQIAVVVGNKAFGAASTPTASGWTQIATISVSTYSTTAFWAQLSGSQTIPFVFPVARDSVMWTVQEFAGCDPTTPINSNFITATASSTTPAGTLPNAFANANSGVFACDALSSDTITHTAGSGYSLIYDSGNTVSFSNERLATEWRNSNNASPSFTVSLSSAWSFLACELVGVVSFDPATLPQPLRSIAAVISNVVMGH